MRAPTAKPPRAGPQPHPPPPPLASAVGGVTIAASAMVVAAIRAVRDFLIASPRCELKYYERNVSFLELFPAGERNLSAAAAVPVGGPSRGVAGWGAFFPAAAMAGHLSVLRTLVLRRIVLQELECRTA